MKYNNLLVIGDLSIDTLSKKKYNGKYFSDLCDPFSLKNLQLMFFCLIRLEVFTTLPFLNLASVIVTK